MPTEGFKTISVRGRVYDAIEASAEKHKRSLANEVEAILEECGVLKAEA